MIGPRQLRALRRLRHATILASIVGHTSNVAWMWFTPGIGGGLGALPVLGAAIAALLMPTFFLAVTRASDALDGAGKPSFGTIDVWASCLLPFWSMFMLPMLMVRVGKLVAQSTETPALVGRTRVLAALQGVGHVLAPMLGIVFFHSFVGAVVLCVAGVLVFAVTSLLLVEALEEAAAARAAPTLGGIGNDEPMAIKTV